MQGTTKYPVGVRLAIILGFPALFWIIALTMLSRLWAFNLEHYP